MTSTLNLQPGTLVNVLPRYAGNGHYDNDQWTGGPFTVIKMLPPFDYKLARGVVPVNVGWDVIVHASRIQRRS